MVVSTGWVLDISIEQDHTIIWLKTTDGSVLKANVATTFQMTGAIFNLGNTLAHTSRNCSSRNGGRCKRRNRDCNGLESLVISLHAANTFAPLIL